MSNDNVVTSGRWREGFLHQLVGGRTEAGEDERSVDGQSDCADKQNAGTFSERGVEEVLASCLFCQPEQLHLFSSYALL